MKEEKIISEQEIEKLEDLIKIKLDEKEKAKVADQLDSVLKSVEVLKEIQMGDFEKESQVFLTQESLRVDEVRDSAPSVVEGIRSNFCDKDGDYLKIKEVIKK